MKKIIATLMITTMCITLLAGCGAEYKMDIGPYSKLKYNELVTLPDYSEYEVEAADIEVTDEDVEAEIQARLENAASKTEEVTEGKVEKGDTVKIDFKGTLEDGSSLPGMAAQDYEMTLGAAAMIDGFQEGLYGATIGEINTLDLEFPDPYTTNEELSGKKVTFVITVKSKIVPVQAELNEDFFKSDSEDKAKTEEEYRAFIKDFLTEKLTTEAEYKAQTELYYEITDNSKVENLPEEALEYEKNKLTTQYKGFAEQNNQEWEDFVKEYFQSQEEFDKQMDDFVNNVVEKKLIAYALAANEKVKVSDKEYSEKLNEYLENFGTDKDAFKTQTGMTIVEYTDMYELPLNLHIDKTLKKIYDRLTKE